MFLLAALLCNYGRGKCLIDIGTEGIGVIRIDEVHMEWRVCDVLGNILPFVLQGLIQIGLKCSQ
jgi:hypothetical protein